jgi:small-conductance mechanosensitive channel
MIATVSPSMINYHETLSTLRYASNAKKIINKVKINEDDPDKINVLKTEIENLRNQLSLYKSDDPELNRLKEELKQREQLILEKEKSWEQKLEESRKISRQIQLMEEELQKRIFY